MTEIAISLTNVSKCFKCYSRPADRLKDLLLPGKSRADEFWALRDINLEVPKGQTLGIVGRNGSGKSTLLQIIVGTLTPTSGLVRVNGRIAALLELGSGFNPEFTGRQNVFFNGRLMGLSQKEIEAKFDEIVAFADIGDFLDQPVKTYSSGMFVRLAFAVSTSVDPDILVVDEALSVGDEAFQRKCFARIQTIRARGGTILFVSHSATAVIEICDAAILMDRGEKLLFHHPKFVLDKYHKLLYAPEDKVQHLREEIREMQKTVSYDAFKQNISILENKLEISVSEASNSEPDLETEPENIREFYDPELVPSNTISYVPRGAKITNPHITMPDGRVVNHLVGKKDYIYTYSVAFLKHAQQVRFGMLVKTVSGLELGGASFTASSQAIEEIEPETIVIVKFRFKCLLNPGVYFLNAGVTGLVDGHFTYLSRHIDVAMFRVQPETNSYASGIVDLMIEPSLTINADLIEKHQEIEVF
ncbi:ABC transporter ATP-binding protein [Planktothrix sp. FACHB-1355]|uniref:ABC transporter ATP-binding protein n=1 Tax=Aerosakkonema funiforme FACHB-1375 TaxID=2949571 RepID=A0A926ZIN0_9CYAN|nr:MULTISPECIES: ABC transporter ATP-binding protein [Oscillatoriales]MBD2183834.1 ABC transporter ATP-binding protein [Aerosakkonema funiforme FACHB-1375]MBD3560847.1 ABC transporter ATP-binding protein [Planktothrix sp. FACHB-1355]